MGGTISPSQLRMQLDGAIKGVEGFLRSQEAWALHEAARLCAPEVSDFRVVEIGSWKGRSTIAMALGLAARGSGRLSAIDPHSGSQELIRQHGPIDTYNDFIANVRQAGVTEIVEPIRMSSHSARERFADKSIHLLFLDGSHEYDDVAQDIRDWTSALTDVATIAFNDPTVPGVYAALDELVLCKPSAFRRPRLVENTLFFEFGRAGQWRIVDSVALMRLKIVLFLFMRAIKLRPYMPTWLVRFGYAVSGKMIKAG